jgi:hypothetical protein
MVRLFATWLALLLSLRASAMTVDATAQPGQRWLADVDGVAVPGGTSVWIGRLTGGITPVADVATVLNHWQSFGQTTTRTLGGQAGRFSASFSKEASEFGLERMFILVLRTTDNATPALDGTNLTAWGLFASTSTTWRFPDNEALPPANATFITTSQVTQSWGGSVTASQLRLSAPFPTPRTAYDQWASSAFPANIAAEDRLPLADPDHDGSINALECLLNTPPLLGNTAPLQQGLNVASAEWTHSYSRSSNLPLSYEKAEFSTDLVTWSAAMPSSSHRSIGGSLVVISVSLNVPRAELFGRLCLPWLRAP